MTRKVNSPARVLIIGDCMLDKSIRGPAHRLAPEGPVPVISNYQEEYAPGGAANVAVNVASLGGEPYLVGLVGRDAAGEDLKRLLDIPNLGLYCLLTTDGGPTTVKTRVYAEHQLLARYDREAPKPDPDLVLSAVRRAMDRFEPQIVVVADYGKGCVEPKSLMSELFRWHLPVIVDPKHTDISVYNGAWLFKPNLTEAWQAVYGKSVPVDLSFPDDVVSAGHRLRTRHGFQNVVITCGPRGLVWCGQGPPDWIHEPAFQPRELFDVMGAGDTITAALAVANVEQQGDEAFRFAAVAAGLAVGKQGTSMVDRAEVIKHISPDEPIEHKILRDMGEVKAWAEAQHAQGHRIVFSNGVFDLLHPGHHSLLRAARRQGDALFVALNSDESARKAKGETRPVIGQLQRALMVAGLSYTTAVCVFDGEYPTELVEAVKPNVMVKGADYKGKFVAGADLLSQWGGRMHYAAILPGYSTTCILDRAEPTGLAALTNGKSFERLAHAAANLPGGTDLGSDV